MNYQSFSDLEKQYLNVDCNYCKKYWDIHILLSGDDSELPKYDRTFRLGDSRARIEQHIEIAKHHLMDDGHYTEMSELELSSFDLLEKVLDLVGFNGTYSEYKEITKIVKSRTLKFYDVTYLILYFFVDDLLEALKKSNPWVRLAGKYENDPHYDEVLAHIEEYRKELDTEEN